MFEKPYICGLKENMESFTKALVVKNTGSRYNLLLFPGSEEITAILRGKMRLKGISITNPVAVGDYVNGYFGADGTAVISEVCPRRNYLIRKSANLSREAHIIASNLDMAYLVLSLGEPDTPLPFIDRFLVTCEAYRVPVTIIMNKYDLASNGAFEQYMQSFRSIYEGAGYRIIPVSAKSGEGIETLRQALKDKVSLFAGVSGVGKSSIANALDSNLCLKTAEISAAHSTGKHTTTFYQMHALSSGGMFIDSPGIKGFGLVDMQKEEIYHFFPEIFKASQNCKYNPCIHIHEPHCAVRKAVEEGVISASRYGSYLKITEGENGKYR